MLKDNLVMLRNLRGFTQEELAERIGISRQAYAKWETGATIPDIVKCGLLAELYGVSIDSLLRSDAAETPGDSVLTPKGKNIWGSVTLNDRGQLVIPKGARDRFCLSAGSRLIVLSDEDGIALIPAERFEENMRRILELAAKKGSAD